jgi:2-methylisocitrate lyase-like PEP mutase family enzyme
MADPRLRRQVAEGRIVVAPGVFDMISARIADAAGFDALYVTGYGTVASHLGLPDAGIATYTDMVGRVARICAGTSTPVIADADTGYGGLLNVRETVRGYEAAGVSAIQIEDQEFPKRCGHTPGRRVVPMEDMVRKLRVAVEARRTDDMLIIARTDARRALGLGEALRRGRAYGEAGADIVFVESPESEAELAEIAAAIPRPLFANMVNGGRTPILPAARLRELGCAIAIYPALGFLAAGAALRDAYAALRRDGDSTAVAAPLYPFADFNLLLGFQDVWDFERRHPETA